MGNKGKSNKDVQQILKMIVLGAFITITGDNLKPVFTTFDAGENFIQAFAFVNLSEFQFHILTWDPCSTRARYLISRDEVSILVVTQQKHLVFGNTC